MLNSRRGRHRARSAPFNLNQLRFAESRQRHQRVVRVDALSITPTGRSGPNSIR